MAVMLENEKLRVLINEHGAELASLISKENGFEYMWSGDRPTGAQGGARNE